MKVSTEQRNAKAWSQALVRLNAAEAGQIQITYQDENGNKQVGYTDLFNISIVVDKKVQTLGEWLTVLATIIDRHGTRLATKDIEIEELKQRIKGFENAVAEIKAKFPDTVWGL